VRTILPMVSRHVLPTPKAPAQNVTPPPPPVVEDTGAKEQEQADLLRRRKGRASSVMAQGGAPAMTATKQLLGS
jgi:hypothetical protein